MDDANAHKISALTIHKIHDNIKQVSFTPTPYPILPYDSQRTIMVDVNIHLHRNAEMCSPLYSLATAFEPNAKKESQNSELACAQRPSRFIRTIKQHRIHRAQACASTNHQESRHNHTPSAIILVLDKYT